MFSHSRNYVDLLEYLSVKFKGLVVNVVCRYERHSINEK